MIWNAAISQFVNEKHLSAYSYVGTGLQTLGFKNRKT